MLIAPHASKTNPAPLPDSGKSRYESTYPFVTCETLVQVLSSGLRTQESVCPACSGDSESVLAVFDKSGWRWAAVNSTVITAFPYCPNIGANAFLTALDGRFCLQLPRAQDFADQLLKLSNGIKILRDKWGEGYPSSTTGATRCSRIINCVIELGALR